ncbi:MAG: hypothetical protein ACOC9Z_06585 [Chloroflexota bacterium]
MSDYYQQQVTLYMMRRAKRKTAEATAGDEPAPTAVDKSGNATWLARLGDLLPKQPAEPALPRPSGKVESA